MGIKRPARKPARKGSPPRSGPPQKAGPTGEADTRVRGGTPDGEDRTEQALVAAAQNDPAKFDALYELHFERVYAFVASRARDRATAEDVTSAVFHKALEHLPKYEWRGVPFAAWLLRIAANAIVDQAKRERRESPLEDDSREGDANGILHGSQMRGEELRAIEHRARLFRLVGELPEPQKQVIFERFVEQRSIAEIAGRLGKTAGAIKQLQLRAVQRLRTQMEGRHG